METIKVRHGVMLVGVTGTGTANTVVTVSLSTGTGGDTATLSGAGADVEGEAGIVDVGKQDLAGLRCEGDAINENWWQDGQWQRQRITTMRAHDTFGVTSGLTEEISPVATQVIRFDITRNTDGEVTETRRRLFPSRGEGVCRDELRVHAEGDYALEIFDCMAGW